MTKIDETSVPIAMFVGIEDELADVDDARWIRD